MCCLWLVQVSELFWWTEMHKLWAWLLLGCFVGTVFRMHLSLHRVWLKWRLLYQVSIIQSLLTEHWHKHLWSLLPRSSWLSDLQLTRHRVLWMCIESILLGLLNQTVSRMSKSLSDLYRQYTVFVMYRQHVHVPSDNETVYFVQQSDAEMRYMHSWDSLYSLCDWWWHLLSDLSSKYFLIIN